MIKQRIIICFFCFVLIISASIVFRGINKGVDDKNNHEFIKQQKNEDDPSIEMIQSLDGPSLPEIMKIPIPLDSDMEDHLSDFRMKASELQYLYPESFIISGSTEQKSIALTFDDGPDQVGTKEIINILDDYNIPATFFLVGNSIDSHPDIMNMIRDGGHIAANHSWSHKRPTDITISDMITEVDKANHALDSYIKEDKKLFRPPYGLVTPDQMEILNIYSYTVISWSVDSMDWYFEDAASIVECVVRAAHPGAIVLMHSAGGKSNRRATIEALPTIIEILSEEGYKFVTIKELLDIT